MSNTHLSHLSEVPVQRGLPSSWSNPIKPELFAGKAQASLAKRVALQQFGVNHVTLEPGAASALRHWHEAQDELVYVLAGELTLIDDNGAHTLREGSFAGFPAGVDNGHHLLNRSHAPASFLVVGTRCGGDVVHYPDDDLGPIAR